MSFAFSPDLEALPVFEKELPVKAPHTKSIG
jgi:hypothetical protein